MRLGQAGLGWHWLVTDTVLTMLAAVMRSQYFPCADHAGQDDLQLRRAPCACMGLLLGLST